MDKIGVIGAGLMGHGIAHSAALAGYQVVLSDVSLERAEKGKAMLATNLNRQSAKGTISPEEASAALARVTPTADPTLFQTCDLVIEAATENEPLKQKLFTDLCPHLKPDALVASNTSSISITRLARYTDRPERFMGVHFFNPVPVMALVELIRGAATSDATVTRFQEIIKKLGKTPVVSTDSPSFIVNRLLVPMINEAIFALGEGVGTAEDIDTAMKLGANHPMGPLALCDFIGLDTTLAVMRVMYEGFCDPKYRPAPLLVHYVDAGWYGRKTGRGFYTYAPS